MNWWIAGGLLAAVLVYVAVIYNRLVGMNKRAVTLITNASMIKRSGLKRST